MPAPVVIPAQAAVTIANGVDTRLCVFDVRGFSSIALIVRNEGGGGGAAFVNALFYVAVTGGTASPGFNPPGVPVAIDWAPLNATEFPTATTLATLAAGATTYLAMDTRGIVWVGVIAQGNAATTTAIAQISGVPSGA